MKVLHVITTINRGGAENHLVELIRGQVGDGMQVAVAYLKGDAYWASTFIKMGVFVQTLGVNRYRKLSRVLRLRELIAKIKPDIVHSHLPPAELYTWLALQLPGVGNPVMIISKHNDTPFYRGLAAQWVGRLVANRSSRVIAISDAVNHYMGSYLALPPEQIITIPYGIDPRPYQTVIANETAALREAWKVPEEALLLGTVARFVPQKALHILLQAYARYRETATTPCRLVLVGKGPLEADLKVLAEQLSISDTVIWAGFREDIPVVMNAIDCFVLTSIHEGFGLVLLEAMAAGKPVVATVVSAIPEVVQHGKTGILCPVNDPISLAKAFKCMEQSELRREFGNAGVERVHNDFTLESMIAKTQSVYQKCL